MGDPLTIAVAFTAAAVACKLSQAAARRHDATADLRAAETVDDVLAAFETTQAPVEVTP